MRSLPRRRRSRAPGPPFSTVLHDLNLASAYADRIAVLEHGRIESVGTPQEIITVERLRRIWRVDCEVLHSPLGRPQVLIHPGALAAEASAPPSRIKRARLKSHAAR